MTKQITKADQVRAIIRSNILLVQNGQDEEVIEMIRAKVGYSKNSDNKRAYNANKDKVIEQYRKELEEEAGQPTLNKDGNERKQITKRKGKSTFANKVRGVITHALVEGLELSKACDEIEELVIKKYEAKGKLEDHKPSYFRLIARNELERVTPSIQASMGLTVSTPAELKQATRTRKWTRHVEA